MKKIVFLDIDGTLVGHNDTISHKTKRAIMLAQNNGHKVFICTGRSESEVFENILSAGFDGMVYSNGAYVVVENQGIFKGTFPLESIQAFDAFMNKHDIAFSVQNASGLLASSEYIHRFEEIAEQKMNELKDVKERKAFTTHREKVREALKQTEVLVLPEINNVSFIAKNQKAVDRLVAQYDKAFEIYQNVVPIFGSFSGEIGLKGITKGAAILKVTQHYGTNIVDTIGIGDGVNDIPMLEIVGVSVAMGNAPEIVKSSANMVTASVDNDGIYHAFKELSLI